MYGLVVGNRFIGVSSEAWWLANPQLSAMVVWRMLWMAFLGEVLPDCYFESIHKTLLYEGCLWLYAIAVLLSQYVKDLF